MSQDDIGETTRDDDGGEDHYTMPARRGLLSEGHDDGSNGAWAAEHGEGEGDQGTIVLCNALPHFFGRLDFPHMAEPDHVQGNAEQNDTPGDLNGAEGQ